MRKEEVYQDLKDGIMRGRIKPGEWLIERELCEQYGLSRTPVREVLVHLVSDGLLVRERSKGFFVRVLRFEQVIEVFQAREAVEGMAARLACQRLDARARQYLGDLHREIAAIDAESDPQLGVRAGRKLHNFVIRTASNELLADVHQRLNNIVYLTANLTTRTPGVEKVSQKAHLEIIDALRSGDQDAAEEAMRRHLRTTCNLLASAYFSELMTTIDPPDPDLTEASGVPPDSSPVH